MYLKSYDQWFDRREDCQIDLRFYAMRPDKISRKNLMYYDGRALNEIREAEAYIQALKAYRLDLAKRMQSLETMSYHTELSLVRHRGWNDPVSYYLALSKVYEDGTVEDLQRTVYEGRERHTAIADYKKLLKQHPGINAKMDIAKSKYER